MANSYLIVCVKDYEIVTPASRMILVGMYGDTHETDTVLPEHRVSHRTGERYTARRKADAQALINTGKWAWEDCDINRQCGRIA